MTMKNIHKESAITPISWLDWKVYMTILWRTEGSDCIVAGTLHDLDKKCV